MTQEPFMCGQSPSDRTVGTEIKSLPSKNEFEEACAQYEKTKETVIEFSEGALAGMRQILTGMSDCPLLTLTSHEITDLVLSGRAFGRMKNQDGTLTMVEIVDDSKELQKLEAVWRKEGSLRTI